MEHLPPWLRNLPLPPRPPSPGDAPIASGANEDVPEWLRELQSEISSDTPATSGDSDWLADLRASAEEHPPEQEQADEQQTSTTSRVKMPVGATDWLRSIGRDPDAPSEPISEPISAPLDESGVPDWLRDLTPDEVARAVETDVPDEVPDSQSRFDPQAPGWLVEEPVSEASTEADEAPAQPSASDETADAADVPDWLRDVIDTGEPPPSEERRPAAEPTPQLTGGVDVPAWLRELGEDQPPAEPPPPADAVPDWLGSAEEPPPAGREEEDIPSWLREAEQAPAAAQSPAGQEEEIPSWLREAEQAPAAAQPPAGGEEEIPSWLREAEQAPAAAQPPAGGEEEIPSWLREAEQAPAADQPPAGGEEEIPSWLQEAEQAPAAADDQSSPTWLREALAESGGEPASPAQTDEDVPSWLTDESPPPPPPIAPQPSATDLPPWLVADEAPSAAPAGAPSGDLGLPSWLRGVADEPPAPPPSARSEPPPPPPRRPVPVAEEGDTSSGFMKGAELPSWLRVPEPELPSETAEGQQLDWLRRLGGTDEEEGDSVSQIAPAERPQRRVYQRSAEQQEAIALLQNLSRAPYPAPVAEPAPAPRTALQRIGLDRIIYALLALALILGLLLPQLTGPFQTSTPAAAGAAELSALLDSLDSEDVVLVAYEWAAQRTGELRPLEQAVLSRLIADKTKLILVSTDMQGTLLSFDLREPLRAAGYNVEPDGREFGGRDYVLLGYRPGGELALRSLAQDLRGELASDFRGQDATESLVANHTDGTPRISSIRDLALILVMADQPQDVQAWMEQVRPFISEEPAVPIAFLLPQEAEPLAQPYLRLDNVYHVAGQQGALALLGSDEATDPGTVARISGQLWYSVLVFVVLLLLGGLGVAVTRATGRRARGGAA